MTGRESHVMGLAVWSGPLAQSTAAYAPRTHVLQGVGNRV